MAQRSWAHGAGFVVKKRLHMAIALSALAKADWSRYRQRPTSHPQESPFLAVRWIPLACIPMDRGIMDHASNDMVRTNERGGPHAIKRERHDHLHTETTRTPGCICRDVPTHLQNSCDRPQTLCGTHPVDPRCTPVAPNSPRQRPGEAALGLC